MKQTILIITIFLILYSCKKDEPYVPFVIPCSLNNDSNTAKNHIKGSWDWIETSQISGSNTKKYLTPKSEGYTMSMTISDSTYMFYKKNILEGTYNYKIQHWGEISGSNFPEDSLTVFAIYRQSDNLRLQFVPISVCENYLVQHYEYVTSNTSSRIWKKK